MARIIGLRHRIKKTAQGEARPTQLCISEDGDLSTAKTLELETDMQERDWTHSVFPTAFKPIKQDGSNSLILERQIKRSLHRHIKWTRLRKGEPREDIPEHLLWDRPKDGAVMVARHVATKFDGLREGDTVLMTLGGSGDDLSLALAEAADRIGASIWRVPPIVLADNRQFPSKDEDAQNLIALFARMPERFYRVRVHDQNLMDVRETFHSWQQAMRNRIAEGQRVLQKARREYLRLIPAHPDIEFEEFADTRKQESQSLQALIQAEIESEKDMIRALERLEIYHEIFEPIKGCGPKIAARLIASIIDIRRFWTGGERDQRYGSAKLKAYCGVHVMYGGKYGERETRLQFPRRRREEKKQGEARQENTWQNDARQALYLLGDQFNRNPNSEWGKKLREYKQSLRARHPEPIEVEIRDTRNGGMRTAVRYSDGHIQKMALWRTITRFVEKVLYREWTRIEKEREHTTH